MNGMSDRLPRGAGGARRPVRALIPRAAIGNGGRIATTVAITHSTNHLSSQDLQQCAVVRSSW
jgi:hypothetical protein